MFNASPIKVSAHRARVERCKLKVKLKRGKQVTKMLVGSMDIQIRNKIKGFLVR